MSDPDAIGCVFLIAIGALSIGIGEIFGDGWGWITLAVIMTAIIVKKRR